MIEQFDAAALLGAVIRKSGPVQLSEEDFLAVSGGKITVEYNDQSQTYLFTYESEDTNAV